VSDFLIDIFRFSRLFDDFELMLGQNVKTTEKTSIETATQDLMDLAGLVQLIVSKEKNIEGKNDF